MTMGLFSKKGQGSLEPISTDMKITALNQRLNSLEATVLELSTILSEVRGMLASLNARVTTMTRTGSKKSDFDKLKEDIAKMQGIDVTHLFPEVKDSNQKELNDTQLPIS